MGWLQLVLGIVALAREIIKYLNEQELERREKSAKLIEIKTALRTARKTGDTAHAEKLFSSFVGARSAGVAISPAGDVPDAPTADMGA